MASMKFLIFIDILCKYCKTFIFGGIIYLALFGTSTKISKIKDGEILDIICSKWTHIDGMLLSVSVKRLKKVVPKLA